MKSIMQQDERCYLCKMAIGTETHHVMFGPNRKYSDQDGLTVRLCWECHHLKAHKASTDEAKQLHIDGQKAWEEYYGPALIAEGKDPRNAFMERYGKNWL